MAPRFVPLVRIFYTVSLFFYGLGLLLLVLLENAASKAGHAPFNPFAPQKLFIVCMFVLLLISRIMQSRSRMWLLLGIPAIVFMYGFVAYVFVASTL